MIPMPAPPTIPVKKAFLAHGISPICLALCKLQAMIRRIRKTERKERTCNESSMRFPVGGGNREGSTCASDDGPRSLDIQEVQAKFSKGSVGSCKERASKTKEFGVVLENLASTVTLSSLPSRALDI